MAYKDNFIVDFYLYLVYNDNMIKKICKWCRFEKSLDNFYSEKRNKDGKRAECKDCTIKYQKERYDPIKEKIYRDNNKEQRSKTRKEYYKKNKEKENIQSKEYKSKRPWCRRFYEAKRRAIKNQNISLGFKEELKIIYKNCPEGMQVDHIIPLKGKNVTGLHVPWNLQYLTPSENASKGNRY